MLGGGPVGGVGAVSELEPCVVVDRDADEEHASLSVGPVRCLDRGVYGGFGGESSEVLADRRSRRFGSPLERLPCRPCRPRSARGVARCGRLLGMPSRCRRPCRLRVLWRVPSTDGSFRCGGGGGTRLERAMDGVGEGPPLAARDQAAFDLGEPAVRGAPRRVVERWGRVRQRARGRAARVQRSHGTAGSLILPPVAAWRNGQVCADLDNRSKHRFA